MNIIPILIAVAIVIAGGVAIAFVVILQRKKLGRTFQVEIRNLGNIQGHYELQAQDPHTPAALQFHFTLNGDELPPVVQSETASVALDEPRQSTPAPAAPTVSAAAPAPSGSGGGASKADQAMESGGIIASILTTLGSILPSSLGAPLMRAASQMRRGQTTASRVKQIKGQSSRLASGRQKARPPAGGGPAAAEHQAVTPAPPGEEAWAQTPAVEPGEALTVDLAIRPAQSHRGQTYPFTVLSRASGLRSTPITGHPERSEWTAGSGLPDPVQQNRAAVEGSVQFSGGSRFSQLLPYLIISAIMILLLAITFLLAYGPF
jgi:hypothetical protein